MKRQSSPEIVAFRRSEQGFEVFGLRNEVIEIEVVPVLGAKVISLRNLVTGYQWMWHPPAGMKLFANHPEDDFATSTMLGWDECIPTIAPCQWKARDLPDHGEAWSVPWKIDLEAFDCGMLKTSIALPVTPFHFERSIRLDGNEIQLDYQLENLCSEPEEFLWAMHPLLPVDDSSQFQFTKETAKHLVGEPWVERLSFINGTPACAKSFAGPIGEGHAAIANNDGRDRIVFEWNTELNHTLGLWLTRGGWNGYHHVALEPTNGSPDALADAAKAGHCGLMKPGEIQAWTVRIGVGSWSHNRLNYTDPIDGMI